MADATRIRTGEGVVWLAAVRDEFSNRIVGWKTSDRCDTCHPVHGTVGDPIGILPSMGSLGDSYHNALMANFSYNTERIQKDLGWFNADDSEAIWHTIQLEPTSIPASPTEAR